MAQLQPFQGLRFSDRAPIEQLTCPPYDIISDAQREAYLRINPHNIIRLELPKGEHPYEDAAKTLKDWMAAGVLRQDDKPSIYIYEEEFTVNGRCKKLKGIIGRVRLEEFDKGVVLPHEETLSKAKADRFELMKATGCNFSQIYSLYLDENRTVQPLIDRMSAGAPEVCFTDQEGVTHRFWQETDAALLEQVCQSFAEKKLYIADGHHRYETALNYRNYLREQGVNQSEDHPSNYVMMMLVSMEDDGLVVLPTHRILRALGAFDPDKLLRQAERYFSVERNLGQQQTAQRMAQGYQQGEHTFTLYEGGRFHLLTYREDGAMDAVYPQASRAYKGLDVAILHALLLERLLGIDQANMKNQVNLTYTRSLEEAIGTVDQQHANCAVLLNPTKVEEIREVALAGEKMPQKSTYFYPKLITGLVMNKMVD